MEKIQAFFKKITLRLFPAVQTLIGKIQAFFKKITLRQYIVAVVTLVLFFGVFFAARAFIIGWKVTSLPGISIADNSPKTTAAPDLPTAEPVAPPVNLPPTWDGASRINVLVMGVDTVAEVGPNGNIAPDRLGPARSDTMILLTIDPQTKTAGMISIPRDLWVNIPGFGYGKINTAHYLGDANKLPGGGPELAMKTVEQVLGVPIQYYARIEFWAFVDFVEDIGKIQVLVPNKITLDPIGPGQDKIYLHAGNRWLGGVEALAYVRNRHTKDGDVDRSRRQQDVIMAIRDRVLDPKNLPAMVAAAPKIYSDLQTGIHTNMSFEDAMRLAMLVKDIPPDSIKKAVIDYTMVTLGNVVVNGQSQSVVKPMPDKIRVLRDELFSSGGALSPMAKGADALDLAKQEGATVLVRNGTGTVGLALATADYLKSLGINEVNADNANELPGVTKVTDYHGRPYALKYFKELFGLNAGAQIWSKYDPAATVDLEIILGNDWALNNPMPK